MKAIITSLALTFVLLANAAAQQPTQQPQPQPTQQQPPAPRPSPAATPAAPAPEAEEEDEEVVRITTNLVQVDAVVTDKDGKQVTGLTADDFEITENGRPQKITNFSYISPDAPTPDPALAAANPAARPSPNSREGVKPPPVPSARLRPEQVRRAVALVVDDLRMSSEGIQAARRALRKYVDEQLQPGDLVAIIRTSAGIGALQQFTSDPQQLHAAIERVRALARTTRLSAFTSINTLGSLETQTLEPTMEALSIPADRRRSENINEFRDTIFTVGTLGALNFVVRGLNDLPGRKAIVLFSDGLSIFNQNSDTQDRNERVLSALRQLVDRATRASVVIHTIDTRGLQPTGLTAADDTSGSPAAPGGSGPGGPVGGVAGIGTHQTGGVMSGRSGELFEGQNGLNYLASETGGSMMRNQNDLNKGIRRALEDLKGYYLIGYRPDESTFDPSTGYRRFNTWDIKVKTRPGMKVRTRSGFIAVADDGRKPTRAQQMMAALLSPFASGGVSLQLSTFFMNDAALGSTIRSTLLMDGAALTFKPLADGRHEAVLDVVAVTLGEEGEIVDQVALVETLRVPAPKLERFRREGVLYGMNLQVSKPGAYQLRVAVRDAATGRIGSASQYVEVPQVGKDKLALSSLVITGNNPQAVSARQMLSAVLGASPSAQAASNVPARFVPGGEGMIGTEDPVASPASRRFRHGMYLDYACVVFNAKLDKGKRPQLTSQVRLFRDGQEAFVGRVFPVDADGQSDATRMVVARRLQLGTILEPGDYALQLIVTDESGRRTATTWTDFKLTN